MLPKAPGSRASCQLCLEQGCSFMRSGKQEHGPCSCSAASKGSEHTSRATCQQGKLGVLPDSSSSTSSPHPGYTWTCPLLLSLTIMLCKAPRKAVLVTLDTATPCPGKDTALPVGARLLYLPQAPQEVLGAGTVTAVALAKVPLALKDQG